MRRETCANKLQLEKSKQNIFSKLNAMKVVSDYNYSSITTIRQTILRYFEKRTEWNGKNEDIKVKCR